MAKDIQTIIITRFFAGFSGSAPITNTGGVLGDIWAPTQRRAAIVACAFAVAGGRVLSLIVGGAVVQNYLRWCWTEYLIGNTNNQSYYHRTFVANRNKPVPQARLPLMMVGSIVIAGGLFLLAGLPAKTFLG